MIATGHGEDQIGITVHYSLPADLIPGLTGTAQNINSTREGYHLRHPVATNKRRVEPLQAQDARRISRASCPQPGNLSSKTRDEFGCLRSSIGGLADSENVAPNVRDGSWAEGKPRGSGDTFAEDLHKLVTKLKLRNFALIGFSMGGGEVARYIGKHGSKDVSHAGFFISSVPPFLLKTPDNQEGVDGSVFEGIQKAIAADRYAFFTDFFKNFYNTDALLGKRVSEQAVQASWNVAAGASATASLACVPTWHEDFRKDLSRIDVPTLVIHGDADRIVPIAAAGERTAKLIKGARLSVVKDGPHCITWTHAEEVNHELVNFLGKGV